MFMSSEKRFEILPHTADIKIRVFGNDLQHLFINALYGMFTSIQPCLASDQKTTERSVMLHAENVTWLLVDFLSECLYLSDVHNEVYMNAVIAHISETQVQATLHGTPISGFEVVEIKAVTYHDLHVEKINNQWQATIVLDI
jgi:SHS2 domain-containing protein